LGAPLNAAATAVIPCLGDIDDIRFGSHVLRLRMIPFSALALSGGVLSNVRKNGLCQFTKRPISSGSRRDALAGQPPSSSSTKLLHYDDPCSLPLAAPVPTGRVTPVIRVAAALCKPNASLFGHPPGVSAWRTPLSKPSWRSASGRCRPHIALRSSSLFAIMHFTKYLSPLQIRRL
jgi:hypothetical protein